MRRLAPALFIALTVASILTACATVAGIRVVRFQASPSSVAPGSHATLSWDVSAAGPVSVSIDHGVGEVTGLSSVVVAPGATTTYTLTAGDGTRTATATATVTVNGSAPDTQNPSVTIQSPADGASLSVGSVDVRGVASDDVGVVGVSYRLNGGSAQPCRGTDSFSCGVTGLTPGSNSISVQAADAAGNAGSDSVALGYAPPGTESYSIDLHFVSPISATQKAAFDAAAARWQQIITQGLPDTPISVPQGACGYVPNSTTVSLPTVPISGTIDDLRIDVWVGTIDGAGGTLGQGGPCVARSGDGLSVYGTMMFDAADLTYLEQNDLLQVTILHEMGHVLGIGTLWTYGRSLLTGAGSDDPRFVGASADSAWHALGGTGDVPVENCIDASGNPIQGCGAGTRDGHWREAVFGNELMTGWINPGSDPLSRVTVASLRDLGYVVDLGQADTYSLPAGLTTQSSPAVRIGTFLLTSPTLETP